MEKIIIFKSPIYSRQGMNPVVASLLTRSGAERVQPLSIINAIACKLPQGKDDSFYKNLPDVLAVEDNVTIKLRPVTEEKRWLFGKPKQEDQVIPWGIDRIGANKVWSYSRGRNVKVAVLDSGIDLNHPDLKENIKGGVNALNPLRRADDDNGHGTHVAGTIAAADNGTGVVGVAPSAHIYSVKIIDRNGEGKLSDIIGGLDWCLRNKMQVANLSVGTSAQSMGLRQAVRRATNAGIILVAAAGNDGRANSVDYPAALPEVIAVGSIDENNRLSSFSSRGPEVTAVAPGSSVYSTAMGGTYKRLSGTSMATPHVSGLVSLALQMNGRLNTEQVMGMLRKSCESLPYLSTEDQGYGLVNAQRMLSLL